MPFTVSDKSGTVKSLKLYEYSLKSCVNATHTTQNNTKQKAT